jgi:hypothetical protein
MIIKMERHGAGGTVLVLCDEPVFDSDKQRNNFVRAQISRADREIAAMEAAERDGRVVEIEGGAVIALS